MMKKTITVCVCIVATMLLNSCDIVESPYAVPTTAGNGGNDSVAIRKVLLEDYTGHQCQGCPAAHDEAVLMQNVFQDSLVVITVHAGYWTSTSPAPFTYDFKTTTGTELYTTLIPGSQPFPLGTINRKNFGVNRVVDYPNWGSKIRELLNDVPVAQLKITPQWNASTRTITAKVSTSILSSISGDIALSVLFTEDSIVKWQKFPSPTGNVETYVHRHVLRGSLNGTWGSVISTNPTSGNVISSDFTGTPIAADIVPERVSIVAILFDNTTREIIQVEEKHLLP